MTVKDVLFRCPCGAESGWLPLDDAMRWGATHRCDEVQPS